VQVTAPEDTSRPFRLTYRYVNDGLQAWPKKYFYAPLPRLARPDVPETPAPLVPVAAGGPMRLIATSRVELPEGFVATAPDGAVPELVLETPLGSFRYATSVKGRTYEVERDFSMKQNEIALSQFADYRAFDKAVEDVAEYINVRELKPWAFGDSATIDWYYGASTGSLKTLQSAATAGRGGDYKQAIATFEEVTRAEPKNPSAWLLLGWAQARSGARDAAIDTLRMHARETPTAALYKELAIQLADAGLPQEAVAAWTTGREMFPADREFGWFLSERLIALKRYAEAVGVLKPEVERPPASARLYWNLGKAYLGLKQTDSALAAMKRAAEIDASAYGLNEVAWVLADWNAGADIAVTYAERSVKLQEAEVTKLTLATLTDAQLRSVSLLASYWDTLAWAYYRRGNVPDAERYQLAAWQLGQSRVMVEHLSNMAESRKDMAAAIRYLAQAASLAPNDTVLADAMARVLPVPAERAQAIADARVRMAAERTVSVPRLPAMEGIAEAFVRVGPQGAVDDVKFITGAATLRPQVEMLRTVTIPSSVPTAGVAIIRRGALICANGAATCEFHLTPASMVTSVK